MKNVPQAHDLVLSFSERGRAVGTFRGEAAFHLY